MRCWTRMLSAVEWLAVGVLNTVAVEVCVLGASGG